MMPLDYTPPVTPHCDCEHHGDVPCDGPLYLMLPDRHGIHRCARHIRVTDAWLKAKYAQAADGRYTAPRRDYDPKLVRFCDWWQTLSETDRQKAEMVGEIDPRGWQEI